MIRGTKRPISRKLELRADIHNRFDVEVIDAATGEIRQRARAFNLICDTFWSRVLHAGSNNAWANQLAFCYVLYGGGSGTPAASDTELFTKLGAKSVSSGDGFSGTVTPNIRAGVVSYQAVIMINAEENVGDTFTEVGIGYDSTHIVTHAMLEDMNGNPISITKTATDVINIFATIFVRFSDGGWYGGSINIAPFSDIHTFIGAIAGAGTLSAGNTDGTFSRRGAGKTTGAYVNGFSSFTPTVDLANKKITIANRIAAGELNMPIRSIYLTTHYYYSYNTYERPAFWLTPGSWCTIPAISGEAVGTGDGSTTAFSTAFPVKTAGTVYVDGVGSAATMRTGPADAAHMEQWFNALQASGASALSESGNPLYANETGVSSANNCLLQTLNAGTMSPAYENPFYAVGLASFEVATGGGTAQIKIQASDDCASWSDAGTATASSSPSSIAVPAALKNKKYWRFVGASGSATYRITATGAVSDTAHNIVFSTAPAAGAVITCDYTPDCIPKDSDHVFDITLELTLGEYTEG